MSYKLPEVLGIEVSKCHVAVVKNISNVVVNRL
jgi:hypothetical protein